MGYQIVSQFKLRTTPARDLPETIRVMAGKTTLAEYAVMVDKGGSRTLVSSKVASDGFEFDVTTVKAIALPKASPTNALVLSSGSI